MTIPDLLLLAVVLLFVGLLVLEWWFRNTKARVAAVLLVLVVLPLSQPVYYRDVRSALAMPAEKRVKQARPDGPLVDDYVSGVLTMYHAVRRDVEQDMSVRLMCLAVLAWLAVSPAIPRKARRDKQVESSQLSPKAQLSGASRSIQSDSASPGQNQYPS